MRTGWRVGDAPPSYIDKMLRAIVGIEIPIDRLEGKLKASQDEAMPDRLGTVRGLQAEASDEAGRMADLVMQAIKADPPAASGPPDGPACGERLHPDARRPSG
jgi:transcriptional regulator